MLTRLKQIAAGALLGFLIPTMALGQTATLLPNAVQQYFNAAGQPLAAGTIDYYVPNTTTRKTTWSSPTESALTQNTNPVLLSAGGFPQNSSGAVSGTYGDGSYRQVVKDQNGTTIWDLVTSSTGSGGSSGGGTISNQFGVPVGAILPWGAMTLPSQYLYAAGESVSRISFPDLLTALTFSISIVCSSGIATISVSTDISDKTPIGAPVESGCFVPGTHVIAKSSGILTLSNNATITISTPAQIFPWGNGNGSSTFNVPDLRGIVPAGRDNMGGGAPIGRLTSTYFGTNPAAINAIGGGQSAQLSVGNIPAITSQNGAQSITVNPSGNTGLFAAVTSGTISSNTTASVAGPIFPQTSNNWSGVSAFSGNNSISVTSTGTSDTPFSIIQPSVTSDYIIKALPDTSSPGVVSIGGMTGTLVCGAGILCASSTISVNISAGAATLYGNPTNSSGIAAPFTIQSLPARGAPDANNDKIPLYNNATGVIDYVTPGQIASSATSGVSSLDGFTGALTGADLNIINSQSSNYPIVNGDCGKTILVSSGGNINITLPSTSGFPTQCLITVKNNQTTRALSLLGFPSDLVAGCGGSCLWPGQSVQVAINNAGSAWFSKTKPNRWLIPSSKELCVRQDGSANSDGLGDGTVAADCLNSIQTAVVLIGEDWDGGGYNACSVGLFAGGTSIFNESVSQTGQSIGCYLTFNMKGTVTWTGTGPCLNAGDNSVTIVNWTFGFIPTFKCNTSNSAGSGQFYCHQTCIFDFNGGPTAAIWIPGGVEGMGTGGTKGTNDVFFYVDLQGSASYNAQVNVGNGVDTFNPLAFVFAETHASQITLSGSVASSALVTFQQALVMQIGSVITHNLTWPGSNVTNATKVRGNSILIQGATVPVALLWQEMAA